MLSISSIILPRLTDTEDIKPFIQSLSNKTLIKEVALQDSLDAEGKDLLLQTVIEKKTLFSFKRYTPHTSNSKSEPVDAQIDFYLRLNRLGRQIVECTNVPASCWPILLSRMMKSKDVVALFYFVREYFVANHHQHDETSHQQESAAAQSEQASSPCKRPRIE
jgi:hypothetical protein